MKQLLCLTLAVLLLCGCTAAPAGTTAPATTVPETTVGPQLQPGYYVPVNQDYASTLFYIQLLEDGSGLISMMGVPHVLTWTPEGASFMGAAITPSAGGLVLEEELLLDFTYTGESLPEDFLPGPPAPGIWAVSSIGWQGDTEFFGKLSQDNGYLELLEDGTGTLVLHGGEYPFVLDGITAKFDGWSMLLMDISDPEIGGSSMLAGYTYDGVIRAESIVFHLLEE